jgi:hypothetical protein
LFIPIGQDNFIDRDRVVAISPADSSPSKRLRRDVAEKGQLIDATGGRKTRSMIIMDTGHVVLCSLQPETLRARLDQKERGERERPEFSRVEEPSET